MKKQITSFPAPALRMMGGRFENAQLTFEFILMPPTVHSRTLGTASTATAQFASGERH
tara:strand:+ start:2650 stop:2823 length:174 start_codon:yes stop_codon:yes gene_type:complete